MTGRKRRMRGLAFSLFAKAHAPRPALPRLSLRGMPTRKDTHARARAALLILACDPHLTSSGHFREPPKSSHRHVRFILSIRARAHQEAGFVPTHRYGRGSDFESDWSAERLPPEAPTLNPKPLTLNP
jgi:hypothetical protein